MPARVGLSSASYGRAVAKIVWEHLSAICGVLCPFLFWEGRVQFDSDYSAEDDASPFFFPQVSHNFIPNQYGILLTKDTLSSQSL
jgi:hypothetical protein